MALGEKGEDSISTVLTAMEPLEVNKLPSKLKKDITDNIDWSLGILTDYRLSVSSRTAGVAMDTYYDSKADSASVR